MGTTESSVPRIIKGFQLDEHVVDLLHKQRKKIMKAIQSSVKQAIVLSTFVITAFCSFAQEGVLWTRIPSVQNLEIQKNNNTVQTRSSVVNELVARYNVTNIFQALPVSKNPILQEVYQIECNCNEHELLQEIARLSTIFVNPELGPHYETLYTPNDYSIAFPYDYSLELINATQAWDITTGDSSILISITDAGYDFNHVEFQNKIQYVSSGITNSNPSHGTAVALTAAGATDNEFGKSAIGYNSSLELRGMNYNELLAATYSGANIVNASWAAGCYNSTYGQMVIDEIYTNGTIIVAAAGNGSTCNNPDMLVYPASYNHVISVTSVGPANNHERTIGNPATTHQHNLMVDIAAPGYDLPVAITNNGFTTANGSSFAAPLVSGTIALMLAVNPCLNADQVEYILKQSADTIINTLNPQYAGRMGAGRLDAAKAVEMAKNFSTFPVTTELVTYCQFNSQVINITELNGVAPYSINWSHGVPEMFCLTGPSGVYTLDVVDSLGCRFHQEFHIEAITPISVEASIQPITCYGANDGSIELQINGGFPDYTVNWSNGASADQLNNLAAGTYEVQITDTKGCTFNDYYEINEPAQLVVDLAITNPNEFFNGSVDVTAFGGTGELSYQWHTGATTEDLTDLLPGVYQVTVTDENGCSNSKMAYLQSISVAGINDLNSNGLSIYPNPAIDHFTVTNGQELINKIQVISMQGQIVFSTDNIGNTIVIPTVELANGNYRINVEMVNGTTTSSNLVVQK